LKQTGWHREIVRSYAHAQWRRKLRRLWRKGLLPAPSLRCRHAGMCGFVKEMAPADRTMIDAWLEARKAA
jgi:hypothetical protein